MRALVAPAVDKMSATNLAEIVVKLRIAAEAIDRDPNSIEITALWRDYKLGMDSLETFRQIGVSRLLVPLGLLERENCDKGLDRLKTDVLDFSSTLIWHGFGSLP